MDQFGYDNEFEAPEGLLAWNLQEEPEEVEYFDDEPSDLDFYILIR